MRVIIIAVFVCLLGAVAYADVRTERGYRHGKPMRIKVTQIGWADVEVHTARAFVRMAEAAARDGVELWIRSGFRSHAAQKSLFQRFREGWGNKAARPGYSNHQSGRALDLRVDADMLAWMTKHARRFGFMRTVPGEPWHWEYRPGAKRTATARASSSRRRS